MSRNTLRFPLLFDGASGTLYAKKTGRPSHEVDQACLSDPDTIQSMHEAYIEAGAKALKLCTFSLPALYPHDPSQAEAIARAACRIGKKAIEDRDLLLFADLGPCEPGADPVSIYPALFDIFLDEGITNILFETLPDATGLEESLRILKEKEPDTIAAVSFSVGADGLSRSGVPGRVLLGQMNDNPDVDLMGFNCLCGPSHMRRQLQDLPAFDKPLLFMPNAGYPTVTNRHTLYDGTPDYFASTMRAMLHEGAAAVGGCCGTTPDHIAALSSLIERDDFSLQPEESRSSDEKKAIRRSPDRLDANLAAGRKSILVELDPPASDHVSQFLEDAARLQQAGVDLLTIADNPIGRPRADACLLACKVQRELGLDVLPHMTCRDRNLNAIRGLLLGLSMEDVHQLLLVTGDPLPLETRSEVKAVFSFNSRTLAAYVRTLEEEGLCQPFHTLGALDLNARNFDIQLGLALEKEKAGIEGFLTQPVFSKRAIDNLRKARETLHSPIYGGIMPLVSARNAAFLKNEITGMDIPDELVTCFEGKDRQACEQVSLQICSRIAKAISPYVDGFYLMTPFRRVPLIMSLIEAIRDLDLMEVSDRSCSCCQS